MAVLEINRKPTRKELNWFGVIVLAVFGIVGGVVLLRGGSLRAAGTIWAIGGIVAAIYYAVPAFRLPMYFGWIYLFFPIGWTVSHLVLVFVYYIILTPIGLVLRLVGYDPMKRKLDPEAATYWVEHDPGRDKSRYFRQY